jgi:hypothetical protein
MPKNVYCEMCDRWFPITRTVFCCYCGMTLRRPDKTLITAPEKPKGAQADGPAPTEE